MTDYLIICNKNELFWKDVFPFYMEGKIDFGYNSIKYFILPEDAEKYCKIENGNKLNDYQGTGRWLTTFKVTREERDIELLPKEGFEKYDDYDAYNTDSIYRIPDADVIGCPIGIIDYPIKGYKVIGELVNNSNRYDYGTPTVNNKKKYVRVLIKKDETS